VIAPVPISEASIAAVEIKFDKSLAFEAMLIPTV
jgi:hypothetical protein